MSLIFFKRCRSSSNIDFLAKSDLTISDGSFTSISRNLCRVEEEDREVVAVAPLLEAPTEPEAGELLAATFPVDGAAKPLPTDVEPVAEADVADKD